MDARSARVTIRAMPVRPDSKQRALELLRRPRVTKKTHSPREWVKFALAQPGQRRRLIPSFLHRLRAHRAALLHLHRWGAGGLGVSEGVYRFYHQSFKVFSQQDWIAECVREFAGIYPRRLLNRTYCLIAERGLVCECVPRINKDWLRCTGPVVESSFHTWVFLDALVRVMKSPAKAVPQTLTAEWGIALYLWDLR